LNETNSANEAPMKQLKKQVEKKGMFSRIVKITKSHSKIKLGQITTNRKGKSTRRTKVIDFLSDVSDASSTSETSFESIPSTSSVCLL
jgi:hypothetical protein